MIYPMYAYRDSKVGFLVPPMCDQSDQSAIRNFSYAINGNEGIMNYSPADFDLFKIGEFNTETGELKVIMPENICSGISVFGDKKK